VSGGGSRMYCRWYYQTPHMISRSSLWCRRKVC